MSLIDVHAHLFDAHMPVTPAEAVANAQAAGVVQMVVPGLDVATSRQAIEIARQFPGVCFATVGVHPSEVLIPEFDLNTSIGSLNQLINSHPEPHVPPWRDRTSKDLTQQTTQPDLSTPRSIAIDLGAQDDSTERTGQESPFTPYSSRLTGPTVGIGEVGIDYYHYDREKTGSVQREAFAAQLSLAVEHDLPVIVHGRKAYDDVLDVIRAHPGSRGLLHSFEASYEVAKQALDLGWLISLTALVTYPGNSDLRDVVRRLPLDRITVETDAPYLPPQSVRDRLRNDQISSTKNQTNTKYQIPNTRPIVGKRGVNNQPAYLVETAQVVAELQGVSLEQLEAATTKTARTFFQLHPNNLSS